MIWSGKKDEKLWKALNVLDDTAREFVHYFYILQIAFTTESSREPAIDCSTAVAKCSHGGGVTVCDDDLFSMHIRQVVFQCLAVLVGIWNRAKVSINWNKIHFFLQVRRRVPRAGPLSTVLAGAGFGRPKGSFSWGRSKRTENKE